MERLNSIFPHIQASKVKLSFVEKLFPNLKDNPYIVLHKNVPDMQLTDYGNRKRNSHDCSARHDVTGSPLKYSLDNCEFDDTLINIKHIWRKEEESYVPLSRNDACKALNVYLEHFDDNTLPVLALCDETDSKRSKLIGSIVCDNWFTTLEVVSKGFTTLTAIRKKFHQKDLELSSSQKCDTKVSTLNVFKLFGTKQESIDWNKTSRDDFEGSIHIETYSNNLTLNPKLLENILIVEVNAGWKNSSLKELQSQLLLLVQYISIIDEYKENDKLQDLIKFSTPYLEKHDDITRKLDLLLNGDISLKNFYDNKIEKIHYVDKKNVETDTKKLLEHVQNVSLRQDIDFTALLWKILIATSDYIEMKSYIERVLNAILQQKIVPQVNNTNLTRFMKLISSLPQQGCTSHLLSGSVPLELVVDMGIEKLTRDYLHILKGARFVDLYSIREKLMNLSSKAFNIENYRKRLITLAQIHISLECMLLIEAHLECPIENLQNIFAYVYNKFASEQSPLKHYAELCSQFYTFTMPLSNTIINELNILKMDPTVWRTSLSSHSVASTLTTTTYYSKVPIFATNSCSTDDTNAQKEIYHAVRAISSSMKYQKLKFENTPSDKFEE